MDKNLLRELAYIQHRDFINKKRGTPREKLPGLKGHIDEPHAIMISGVRRCGKSTILTQMADAYLGEKFFYFNFEDERLLTFTPKDFSLLHEVLIECFGGQRVFLLDEIQNVTGWESFIRRMQDEGYKFILTGSNASLLSRELGTKLTGRHISVELSPFSFREFARFHDSDISEQAFLAPEGRARLNNLFEKFRLKGGFPEYLTYDDPEILAQLYEDVIYRDVATRHGIKNTRALRELSLYYMSNVASLCSFNKLKQAFGLGNVTTVSSYTEFLEQSYLISTMNIFDFSVKRQMIAPKKIYAVDTGLANSVSLSFSKNTGALLENIVYCELIRRGYSPSYYKTKSGCEVDFACIKGRRIDELIQVCQSLSDPATRRRELNAICDAMNELGIRQSLILTEGEKEDIHSKGLKVMVVPITRWLLCNL